MIEYRKITLEEKESLRNLIDKVLNDLERKEFFIPFFRLNLGGYEME